MGSGIISEEKSLVAQMDLDLQFIQRNVRDLSKTAQFSHMAELEELHKLAYTNLKAHMANGKMLAEDPQLALEAYKTLSGVVIQIVEVKRKATETMLKARTLIDIPKNVDEGDEGDGLPGDAVVEVSVGTGDGGVFGRLVRDVDGSDPKIAM